jgi:DnaJ-class molecular chaperone
MALTLYGRCWAVTEPKRASDIYPEEGELVIKGLCDTCRGYGGYVSRLGIHLHCMDCHGEGRIPCYRYP